MRANPVTVRQILPLAFALGLAPAAPAQERVVSSEEVHAVGSPSQFGGFHGPPGSCSGRVPTIECAGGACYGTSGDDVIEGTEGDDEIHARGGHDIVCGRRGHDTITGGEGNDTLIGDEGADTINGGQGDDQLNGNGGNDTLVGESGNDRIYGGDDVDVIEGGGGDDFIVAGSAGDAIHAGGGADLVYGEDGADEIYGQGGADVMFGGRGADRMEGGDDADDIYGEEGGDTLRGGDGTDTIAGGHDADLLYGNAHADELDGGPGADVLHGGDGDDRLAGGDGAIDSCDGGNGVDEEIGSTCEDVERIEIPEMPESPDTPGIPEPDDPSHQGAPCDVWDQDCADDEKCVAETVGGEARCQAIVENPDQVGESCDSAGDGDSCDSDGMCVNGTCVAYCGGTPASPTCPQANHACHFYDDSPPLCEPECDPLLNGVCPEGTVCAAENGALEVFTCAVAADTLGDAGDPCTSMTQCMPGNACMSAGVLEFGFCDDSATDCCAPLCDLSEADVCTGGTSCIPFYSDPPPGLENVGVCAIGF